MPRLINDASLVALSGAAGTLKLRICVKLPWAVGDLAPGELGEAAADGVPDTERPSLLLLRDGGNGCLLKERFVCGGSGPAVRWDSERLLSSIAPSSWAFAGTESERVMRRRNTGALCLVWVAHPLPRQPKARCTVQYRGATD